MNVDRRFSARHPIDLKVHIRYRKRRLQCALARNLSAEGMYLDVQSVTLPSGTLVKLELDCDGDELLVPAVVVHRHGTGIGVRFRDPKPELLEALSRISHTHCPEARSRFVATTQASPA